MVKKFPTIIFQKVFHFIIKIKIPRNNFNNNIHLISKDILDYLLKNRIIIDKFIEKFNDKKSRNILKRSLARIYYIYTHEVINKYKIINIRELINQIRVNILISRKKKLFKLPVNNYEASVFFYNCGLTLLPKIVKKKLKNKNFIDGGAFIGDSALIFEKFYQPKKIYAFEPGLEIYNLMLETIHMNNLKKTIPIRKGLGEKEEILKFNLKSSCSYISENGKQSVDVISIDRFASENDLPISLIKMDIEGFELKALKGAEKTIKKFKPVLLISIYHNGEEFFETINFIRKIDSNYKIIARKINPKESFFETILIAWFMNN